MAPERPSTPPPRTDLVYGVQPVREALRGRREVREVVVTEEALRGLPWIESSGVRISRAVPSAITALAGRPDHQGVAALTEPYRFADVDDILGGERPLAVVLDGVTDPRNLGAIARTCEVAGATGLILPRHGSAGITAVVAKASAGAVEHLSIAVVTNLADLLRRAKTATLWSYAADAEGGRPPWELDLVDGTLLVLGSEGSGIRPNVQATCDAVVTVPQRGQVGSLNVSVAAGMLLYEAGRQRGLAAAG